jgi:hypothetical protein
MKRALYILTSLLLTACISPLDISSDTFEEVLVVDGKITTQPGPHAISISRSAKYGSVFDGVITPVENADVSIRDNFGETTILTHAGGGIYNTPSSFRAKVGDSYIINIEVDDDIYNSLPETVEKVTPLDSLYVLYNRYPYLNDNNILNYKSGVDVYAKYSKSDEYADYLSWDYDGVFYIRTFPELFQIATRRGPVSRPKDCCADCFKFEVNNDIIISSFPLGSSQSNERLFFLEDDGYRFIDKYVMVLTRTSISREAYQFYELLLNQLSIDGDIFDPPPAAINGNIINIKDVDKQVIGFFQASDIAIDTLEINNDDLDRVAQLPIFPDDCLVLPNTTVVRPAYY